MNRTGVRRVLAAAILAPAGLVLAAPPQADHRAILDARVRAEPGNSRTPPVFRCVRPGGFAPDDDGAPLGGRPLWLAKDPLLRDLLRPVMAGLELLGDESTPLTNAASAVRSSYHVP